MNRSATLWLVLATALIAGGCVKETRPLPPDGLHVQRTFVRVCAHSGSDLGNEVGGWLLGRWRRDRLTGQRFIVIDASLGHQGTPAMGVLS